MTDFNMAVKVPDEISMAPSNDPEDEFQTIIRNGNKSEVNANH